MDSAVDRLLTLKVKDVMTRQVVCVESDQYLADAAQLLVEKGISGAPVIDAQGLCVGILSALDYVRREHVLPVNSGEEATRRRVREQMSTSVRAVKAEQTLLAAARIMCDKHVHRLPVLDEQGRPAGLITSMDVVAALVNVIDEQERSFM
jgi:CBS domain-containing protein